MPSATTVTKGARGDFGWLFTLLSALMTTLAIVALARHAFVTWSLTAPMALVMDAYNATVRSLLGWTEPYLQAALIWVGSFTGWRPTLYPHWRDIFVLTVLWVAGTNRSLRRHGAAWLQITSLGAVGAIAAALLAGAQPNDFLITHDPPPTSADDTASVAFARRPSRGGVSWREDRSGG